MHDTRQLSLQRLCERVASLIGVISGGILFLPGLALAHGDNNVTVATFIGPMLALVVLVTVVGLGKAVLRTIVRKR